LSPPLPGLVVGDTATLVPVPLPLTATPSPMFRPTIVGCGLAPATVVSVEPLAHYNSIGVDVHVSPAFVPTLDVAAGPTGMAVPLDELQLDPNSE
jgi:hypothetical protein